MAEENIIPLQHIVLLPDGDRRWAKERGLPAWEGHRRGAENLRNIIEACREKNIKYLTVWGFSTENWNRAPQEVEELMKIFKEMIKRYHDEFIKEKVRFKQIGRRDRLDAELRAAIDELEEATKDNTMWHLQIALDYGGRDEIVRATQKLMKDCKDGKISPESLTTESYKDYLDTVGIPDPDLFIRTSGEQRLSGILPYQGVYAEYAFVSTNFPDFTKEKFFEVVESYYERKRRFGAG